MEGDNLMSSDPEAKPRTGTQSSRLVQSKNKSREFLSALPAIPSLGNIFTRIGRTVGNNPKFFIVSTFIVVGLACYGLVGLKLRDNVRDGYTPTTSRARHENNKLREFLGSEGDPVMTTILLTAKDNGTMSRIEYLDETVLQWEIISKQVTVEISPDEKLSYKNFCGHYCQANDVVRMYKNEYAKRLSSRRPTARLDYPIANLNGLKIHLERSFFGVATNESSKTPTNLEDVKLITLTVMSEVKSFEDIEKLGQWELVLERFCRKYTAKEDNILDMQVISAEIVDLEMNKDAQKVKPFFISGALIMIIFVLSSVSLSAYLLGYFGPRVLIVAASCAVVPAMSIAATFGLNNIAGYRTNSPMMIMPFLIMGIGVNDAFLVEHGWVGSSHSLSVAERLARVLKGTGPSITATTMTNVITFIISAVTPTEEIAIFSKACAVALALSYIFTLTLICPLMVLLLKKPTHKPSNISWLQKIVPVYVKIISSKITFTILLIGACVYWFFAIKGVLSLQAKLDTAKILPLDSPIRKPNRMIEEIVWYEFYPVTVIVNHPLNLTDSVEMESFGKFVNEFESMPNCRGREFTISYLHEYHEYFYGVAAEDFDYFADEEAVGFENTTTVYDYSKLNGFLKSPVFKHHKASVRLDLKQKIPVRSFAMVFVYHNGTTWDDRINIMNEWRGIVDRYPQFNASVWNVNAMFVDQVQSLVPLAQMNAVITLICAMIVCALFIQNFATTFIATLAIASIASGVAGYLCFWEIDLDPVSLCAMMVAIGMAVDFVAHTTYHFQLSKKTIETSTGIVEVELTSVEARLEHTISAVAWPMCQGGLSTVLTILPLAFQNNYLPLVFVKTIVLVVIWGLFHGLVLLPCFLCQIPLRFLNWDCKVFNRNPKTKAVELQTLEVPMLANHHH